LGRFGKKQEEKCRNQIDNTRKWILKFPFISFQKQPGRNIKQFCTNPNPIGAIKGS
jgi:hypothetical protein